MCISRGGTSLMDLRVTQTEDVNSTKYSQPFV